MAGSTEEKLTWQRQMERDAVRIAFPDWELRDDDLIVFDVRYSPGYHYSEYTFSEGSFEISVRVQRADLSCDKYMWYDDEDASAFFTRLMQEASR